MTRQGSSFFQTAFWQDPGETGSFLSRREEIAVVVGAGVEGQSYLYWKEGFLFQLPVSYLREPDAWVNSPGFPDGEVFFGRPVTPRCLECHGTYFELEGTLRQPRYRDNYQLGITCWKCHGDGGDHIARHSGEAEISERDDIVLPSELSPERQLDLCALCHSGVGEELRANFTYRPGQELSSYLKIDAATPGPELEEPGGWLANKLFRQSQCFSGSPGATCSFCHDVHKPEGNLALKARACRECHELEECQVAAGRRAELEDRCIDCHMPDQASRRLRIHRTTDSLSPAYRNHRIAIYPEETDQVLRSLGKK